MNYTVGDLFEDPVAGLQWIATEEYPIGLLLEPLEQPEPDYPIARVIKWEELIVDWNYLGRQLTMIGSHGICVKSESADQLKDSLAAHPCEEPLTPKERDLVERLLAGNGDQEAISAALSARAIRSAAAHEFPEIQARGKRAGLGIFALCESAALDRLEGVDVLLLVSGAYFLDEIIRESCVYCFTPGAILVYPGLDRGQFYAWFSDLGPVLCGGEPPELEPPGFEISVSWSDLPEEETRG